MTWWGTTHPLLSLQGDGGEGGQTLAEDDKRPLKLCQSFVNTSGERVVTRGEDLTAVSA